MLIRSLYVAGALGALSHLAGRAAVQTHEPAPPPDSAGTIIGWVSERATCEPVAGALVSVRGAPGARPLDATADSAGRFTLTRVPAGEHALRVRAASLAPAELPAVEVQPGELTDVLVELDRAGTPPIGSSAGRRAAVDSAAPRITWFPERPKQGTLFRITIADSSSRAWTGSVAGEALHFSRDSSGSYSAIAPVPIDAVDSLVVRVGAERRDGGDAGRTVAIPVTPGSYRVEKLRVAPAFGKKPDAALAERLARESKRAREVACRARRTPRLWGATFVRPRPGRVTSGFGHGREFNGVVQSRHMGTDLAGAVGAPIRATNRGVVALVGHFYLGGRIVYLDHGGGLVSAYLHMSKVEVSEGDTVEAGGIVGRVGATGRVTGPHLHWIVRYGAVTVDPMSLFTIAEAPTARETTKGGGGR
jgi:murein DD-endopeptidase MepM/ murein hydrolase activator NlpD